MKCCGADDYMDWYKTVGYIPGSCCQSIAFCDENEVLKLHLGGCDSSLKNLVEYYAKIIFFVLVGLGIIEVRHKVKLEHTIKDKQHKMKKKPQLLHHNNH
uniref:Tetraspanin n=1 Tax=Bracon brevicornis TaxID=1563983 RepID=A0A6V7J2X3_9HYME